MYALVKSHDYLWGLLHPYDLVASKSNLLAWRKMPILCTFTHIHCLKSTAAAA